MSMNNNFRIGFFIVLMAIVVLFNRCQKDTVTAPPTVTNIQFLGHKGSGASLFNPSIIENTLPAVKKGLATLTGVEVDLQMSLDGTIWLFHDLNLARTSCKTMAGKTIILSNDADISKINICSTEAQDRIYTLSELISYWNQTATTSYLSMHIKLDFPLDTINKAVIGGEAIYLAKFADNLAKIIPSVKSPGKIMLEVYDATFCKRIHQLIPGMKVCLLKAVSFPRQVTDAIDSGYDGVSGFFDEAALSEAEVTRAQKSGLIVQLWTPNTKIELTKALNMHPDFIQTDNMNALTDLNVTVKR